eukprot:15470531-Alexandrium_andersonii.AAC.1
MLEAIAEDGDGDGGDEGAAADDPADALAPLDAAALTRRPVAAELLQEYAQTIRSAREPGGSETSSAADQRVA